MKQRITVEIPLPPHACAQNSHVYYMTKAGALAKSKADALIRAKIEMRRNPEIKFPLPPPVTVSHEWYMGRTFEDLNTAANNRMRKLLGSKVKPAPPVFYRPLDIGNAIGALKGSIDGIVASGMLEGDQHNKLKWGECNLYRTAKEHKGLSGVVLTFEWDDDPHWDGM